MFLTLGSLITCGECGIRFAFDSELHDRRRNDGRTFYCPNGHPRAYIETENDRLRKQLESANRSSQSTRDALERERRSHSATKGQLTKARSALR